MYFLQSPRTTSHQTLIVVRIAAEGSRTRRLFGSSFRLEKRLEAICLMRRRLFNLFVNGSRTIYEPSFLCRENGTAAFSPCPVSRSRHLNKTDGISRPHSYRVNALFYLSGAQNGSPARISWTGTS